MLRRASDFCHNASCPPSLLAWKTTQIFKKTSKLQTIKQPNTLKLPKKHEFKRPTCPQAKSCESDPAGSEGRVVLILGHRVRLLNLARQIPQGPQPVRQWASVLFQGAPFNLGLKGTQIENRKPRPTLEKHTVERQVVCHANLGTVRQTNPASRNILQWNRGLVG